MKMNKHAAAVCVFLAVLCTASCSMQHISDKPEIIFTNSDSTTGQIIKTAYINEDGTDTWISVWNGSCRQGESLGVYVDTGCYNLKIETEKYFFTYTYSTGYKQPVTVWPDETCIIDFDGKGIYKQ